MTKLIPITDLERLSDAVLNHLYADLKARLSALDPQSLDCANALASMENIRRVLRGRQPSGPQP